MRSFWPIAARIVVLAAVIVGVRLYADRGSAQPLLGSDSVIPWTPAPPGPAPTPSPTPFPTPPQGVSRCAAGQVRASYWQSGAATGHLISAIAFVNVGEERCFVSGRPTLQLVTTTGRKLPKSTDESSFYPDEGPVPVVLSPGLAPPEEAEGLPRGEASVGFELFDCNTNYQIDRILLTFDGGTQDLNVDDRAIGFSGQAYCDGNPDADKAPPKTTVSNFVGAPEPEPEQERSKYSTLNVSIEAPQTSSAGERFRYLVTLRNMRDQPFDFRNECPTYREGLKGAKSAFTEELYSLNCGGIVIGPKSEVTFEMFLRIPSTSEAQQAALFWNLDAYRFGPSSNALIEIRAS